jgi:hypothetical protein
MAQSEKRVINDPILLSNPVKRAESFGCYWIRLQFVIAVMALIHQ